MRLWILPDARVMKNLEIIALYQEFYGKLLSDLAEKMLHTQYTDRSDLLGEEAEGISSTVI